MSKTKTIEKVQQIKNNIGFGIKPEDIDNEKLNYAVEQSSLTKLIKKMPNGIDQIVGEKGMKISGGEKQRIGIARALYHNPQILILDEATSSLDNQTEKAVMDAVNNLSNDITIILIAHRLSTVKNCDNIFLLEKGELKEQGTFEELIKVNESFRANVNN